MSDKKIKLDQIGQNFEKDIFKKHALNSKYVLKKHDLKKNMV